VGRLDEPHGRWRGARAESCCSRCACRSRTVRCHRAIGWRCRGRVLEPGERGLEIAQKPVPGPGHVDGGDPAGPDLLAVEWAAAGVVSTAAKTIHERGAEVAAGRTGHRATQAGTAARGLRLQGATVGTSPGRRVGNVLAGVEDGHGHPAVLPLSLPDRAPAGPSARGRHWTRREPIHRPWAAGRGRSSRPRAAAHWG
jgi:hypothetical protein